MKISCLLLSFLLFCAFVNASHEKKNVAVIGTGYVGLITAAGVAEFGHTVVGVDVDEKKIALLKEMIIPIYEPGLKELLESNVSKNRISFSTDVEKSIAQADVIFIAVGTPMSHDGSADLSAVMRVAETISKNLNSYKVIVTKSTVPMGTNNKLRALIEKKSENRELFDVVSNPEFLREGSAIHDFLTPDRIVVGTESDKALAIMRDIYRPLIDQGVHYVETNTVSAEFIKYASNAFLATKLSFINEMAKLADVAGADIKMVSQGMGLDKRIGNQFLQPGPGFGGSCFPKDCNALLHIAKKYGLDLKTVKSAVEVNEWQRYYVMEKLHELMGEDISGKTIAVLGLAFKANTDDVRESPALDIIKMLLHDGATVKAYDPVAKHTTMAIYPHITYSDTAYDVVADADAVMVMTEWEEFKTLDLGKIAKLMKHAVMVDARNLYQPQDLKTFGFKYQNIGRSKI